MVPDYRGQDQDSTTGTSSGIQLLDYTDLADDENGNFYSSGPLAAWESTLATWKDPQDIGENWTACGLFTHPDGNKNFVSGSNDKIYWMYEGMFRLLDADELDKFNRWRDGDAHAFDEPEENEQPAPQDLEKKTWVRAPLRKRGGRMNNKWYYWNLEMESIAEESEEEEEKLVVWRD